MNGIKKAYNTGIFILHFVQWVDKEVYETSLEKKVTNDKKGNKQLHTSQTLVDLKQIVNVIRELKLLWEYILVTILSCQ